MPKSYRKRGEDELILALACGATVEAAARKVGISESAVYKRMNKPDFKQKLSAMRAEMVQRAAAMLTAAAMEAVKTLLGLCSEKTPAAVRLGAARSVLEIGIKLREQDDLTERVAALEAQLALGGVPVA